MAISLPTKSLGLPLIPFVIQVTKFLAYKVRLNNSPSPFLPTDCFYLGLFIKSLDMWRFIPVSRITPSTRSIVPGTRRLAPCTGIIVIVSPRTGSGIVVLLDISITLSRPIEVFLFPSSWPICSAMRGVLVQIFAFFSRVVAFSIMGPVPTGHELCWYGICPENSSCGRGGWYIVRKRSPSWLALVKIDRVARG